MRRATLEDVPMLARLYTAAESAVRLELGAGRVHGEVLEPWFGQMLGDPASTFFVQPDAGFVQLAAPRTLQAIYVAPLHWGTGIASVLHGRGLEHLRGLGARRANLVVIARNGRARRFYERQGWQLAGPGEPRDFGGTLLDFVSYERAL